MPSNETIWNDGMFCICAVQYGRHQSICWQNVPNRACKIIIFNATGVTRKQSYKYLATSIPKRLNSIIIDVLIVLSKLIKQRLNFQAFTQLQIQKNNQFFKSKTCQSDNRELNLFLSFKVTYLIHGVQHEQQSPGERVHNIVSQWKAKGKQRKENIKQTLPSTQSCHSHSVIRIRNTEKQASHQLEGLMINPHHLG